MLTLASQSLQSAPQNPSHPVNTQIPSARLATTPVTPIDYARDMAMLQLEMETTGELSSLLRKKSQLLRAPSEQESLQVFTGSRSNKRARALPQLTQAFYYQSTQPSRLVSLDRNTYREGKSPSRPAPRSGDERIAIRPQDYRIEPHRVLRYRLDSTVSAFTEADRKYSRPRPDLRSKASHRHNNLRRKPRMEGLAELYHVGK